MSFSSSWRSLSSRIHGLVAAGKLYAASGPDVARDGSGSSAGSTDSLHAHCIRAVEAVDAFAIRYADSMPIEAAARLREAAAEIRNVAFGKPVPGWLWKHKSTITAMVMLAALETEISHLLSDGQAEIRSRAERAFEHLQRSIIADPMVQDRWRTAFAGGEVDCERLGAAHLLSHGIWTFKANAEGGRTDLIYQEPITEYETMQRAADGLVLTEWKVAKPDTEAGAKFESAKSQAGLYAGGILAGFELAAYRFAVVVSDRRVSLPPDTVVGGATYRHINIAVEPLVPSRDLIP